jgi:hypothetical protein
MASKKPDPVVPVAAYERALADLFGGFDGGWAVWRAALSGLELAVERSREREGGFTSYPAGELRRFLRDVESALTLASTAVDLQATLNGEPRAAGLADVLVESVRDLVLRRAARDA